VSKFGCTCGHTIRDQADSLPYKGQILKDQDCEAYFSGAADALTEYMAGVRSGDLTEWCRRCPFLRGKSDNHVAWTLLGWFWRRFRVDVYECEQCGRLWVQDGTESPRFIAFLRENASTGRVLPSEQPQAIRLPGDQRAET
jgi:hypothetical protein